MLRSDLPSSLQASSIPYLNLTFFRVYENKLDPIYTLRVELFFDLITLASAVKGLKPPRFFREQLWNGPADRHCISGTFLFQLLRPI